MKKPREFWLNYYPIIKRGYAYRSSSAALAFKAAYKGTAKSEIIHVIEVPQRKSKRRKKP